MRKITFWLSLILIFSIPWEDIFSIPVIGSFARLMGMIVAGFWFLTILTEGRFRKPNLFHIFVLLFFLWNIVSYIWTVDLDGTTERIKTYIQIFLLILILWEMYRKPTDLVAGLQAYILGAYVCIASSISNYLHGTTAENYEVRFSATGVNAVDLALILLLGIPLAWHLFQGTDIKVNRFQRIINISYIPLAIFSILLTASRTSLFAIVPALIFLLWPKRLDIGRLIVISMFLVISFLVFRAIIPAGVTTRLATVTASVSTADIGGRVNLWMEAISLFIRHPVVGIGSGTLYATIGTFAHQTLLSVLAETGLVGFLLLACILTIVVNQAVMLPKGYSGLWLAVFFIWFIGILSLSWESTKSTWIFFSFVIIEGAALQDNINLKGLKRDLHELRKA